MRVLMLSDFYPPDCIGGTEQHVQTLSQELVRRGHQVAVASLRNHKESAAFELDEGVKVHRLAGWSRALAPFYPIPGVRFHPPLPDPGIIAGLRRVIEEEHPDIVHAHKWILYSFVPLKAWSRARLVVTCNDYGLVCPTESYSHGNRVCTGPEFGKCIRCAGSTFGTVKAVAQTSGLKASSPMHRYVDRFLAVSSAVRDASIHATGQRPIEVVPAPIPDKLADEHKQIARPSFLPATGDYLLFVGRANAHKGLDVLIAAYESLVDRPRLVLILADDRNGRKLQRIPAGVTVAYQVPHDQVMAAWAHCTVGVVPSTWPEPFGIVAAEAMACSKPVVASDIGGLRDVVRDGETGLLVPPGNVFALRDALSALLTDPARRAQLGVAGRERARQFMASTVTNRIEQIYAEVLANHNPVVNDVKKSAL